jgi:translation initiation factor eIF-2B subunit epsilon
VFRTCKIGNNSLIGSSTRLGDGTQVIASVVGKHCTIGDASVIHHSYIFDGTSIGPGCVIEHTIVGADVIVKANCRVNRGCLIGDGVVIGPNVHLQAFERLSKRQAQNGDGEDSDLEEAETCTFHKRSI